MSPPLIIAHSSTEGRCTHPKLYVCGCGLNTVHKNDAPNITQLYLCTNSKALLDGVLPKCI